MDSGTRDSQRTMSAFRRWVNSCSASRCFTAWSARLSAVRRVCTSWPLLSSSSFIFPLISSAFFCTCAGIVDEAPSSDRDETSDHFHPPEEKLVGPRVGSKRMHSTSSDARRSTRARSLRNIVSTRVCTTRVVLGSGPDVSSHHGLALDQTHCAKS